MSVPLNRKKLVSSSLVTPEDFFAYKQNCSQLEAAPDLHEAKSALLYFSGKLETHIKYNLPVTPVKNLSSSLLYHGQGNPVVLQRSGIGAPSAVTLVEELIHLGIKRIVSIGTAGCLCSDLAPGQIVVCTGAYRDEGTSWHYMAGKKRILANDNLTAKLASALHGQDLEFRQGISWTTDAPYRETKADYTFYKHRKVVTVEMEASALMAVSKVRGIDFASVFVVSDHLTPAGWHPNFNDWRVSSSLIYKLLPVAISVLEA